MNILAIGNSFSEDATYYVHKIAKSANVDVTVVNLYISGCSIETHVKNIIEDNDAYRYELNGEHTDRVVSIKTALTEREWDVVTVQQCSRFSGVLSSCKDLNVILEYVKKYAKNAKIYFHQTWAYEANATHKHYSTYSCSQKKMHKAIVKTVKKACKIYGIKNVIKSGELVGEIRKNPLFNVNKGGQSINRDGYHLSLVYGRYLVGLLWFKVLLDGDIDKVSFVPTVDDIINGYKKDNFECDENKISLVRNTVKNFKNNSSSLTSFFTKK